MQFADWIVKEIKRRKKTEPKVNKTQIIREISEKCGVSKVTVENASRGLTLQRYDKAKAISDATDGKVSVAELCE